VSTEFIQFTPSKGDIDRIVAKYAGMERRRINTVPVMKDIADYMQALIQRNFESSGRRKGGSWPALKKDTIRRKLQLVGQAHEVKLQGGHPFGGGFFIKGGGGVLKKFGQGQPKHVYEPVRLTDSLYDALVHNGYGGVREAKQDKALIGFKKRAIPYGATQRYGGGNNVPSRDFMMMDNSDRIYMLRLVEDYIFSSFFTPQEFGTRRPRGLGGYVHG
jgi:phage gpG-like protein